jgi:hypothetical protein
VASHENYVHFDELDGLPGPNRRNYLFELDFFAKVLPEGASVLQVGSMDGARILRFIERRPDLEFTGLEIEKNLVVLARENIRKAGLDVRFIAADITAPPASTGNYDYVLCLNNTLGFIPDYRAALRRMWGIGVTFVSVYGEAFDDVLAGEYYRSVGIELEGIRGNEIILRGVGAVRRFPRAEVESWGSNITETPIGYIAIVKEDWE